MSREEALAEMRQAAGRDFDPGLILKFAAYLEAESGSRSDFLAKKETALIKQYFAGILQKFSAGKIVPPAMPQVVFELRSVIKRHDSSVKDLADVL